MNHLAHDPIQRASGSGDELEYVGTAVPPLNGALHRVDLAADSPDAIEQSSLVPFEARIILKCCAVFVRNRSIRRCSERFLKSVRCAPALD
jgi:hypothetical protein